MFQMRKTTTYFWGKYSSLVIQTELESLQVKIITVKITDGFEKQHPLGNINADGK